MAAINPERWPHSSRNAGRDQIGMLAALARISQQRQRIIEALRTNRPGPFYRDASVLAHFLSLFPSGEVEVDASLVDVVANLRSNNFNHLAFDPRDEARTSGSRVARLSSDEYEFELGAGAGGGDASVVAVVDVRRSASALLRMENPDRDGLVGLIEQIIVALVGSPPVEQTGADGPMLIVLADLFDRFQVVPSASADLTNGASAAPAEASNAAPDFLANLVELVRESFDKYRASSTAQETEVSAEKDIPVHEVELGIMRLLCSVSCHPAVGTNSQLAESVCGMFVELLQEPEVIFQDEMLGNSLGGWLFRNGTFLAEFRRAIFESPRHPHLVLRGLRFVRCFPVGGHEAIFRSLLQLVDSSEDREIAKTVGDVLGRTACCDDDVARGWAAPLVEEILGGGLSPPLLSNSESKSKFLQGLAFGLKEGAKEVYLRVELAEPYSDWMVEIRRQLEPIYRSKNEGACPVWLYALHWLGDIHNASPEQRTALARWWQTIKPRLLRAVPATTAGDASYIINSLDVSTQGAGGPHGILFLTSPADVVEICEAFVRRVSGELALLDQGRTPLERNWRYILNNDMSSALRDCYRHGRPQGAVLDRLVRLLETLSGAPFEFDKVREVLREVRSDQS